MSAGQVALPMEKLDVLARKVRSAGKRARTHGLAFYRCVLEAGTAALAARALIPHGQFTDWLTENCKVSPRQARSWMKLARMGLTAEQIVEAGGLRSLLTAATEPQNGSAAVLPGDNPPEDAEDVLSETESKWERDEDRTARRRRDAIQRKQDIRDGQTEPLTKMERLQAANAQLQGQVEALERENTALRARIGSLEASLGAGNAA